MPPKKKEEGPKSDHFVEIVSLLLGLYFIWAVFSRLQDLLVYWRVGSYDSIWARIIAAFAGNVWPVVEFLAVVLSAAAVVGITYVVRKMGKIIEEEKAIYGMHADVQAVDELVTPPNRKWEKVVAHINSANSAEWKLAIIEADIMLDDLLRACGYHGDSIGDMLKAVEPSDFLTIESAWEAHKVRNRIAHDGSTFDLNEREAKRVVALYEAVFKEFKVI
ncbi:MAG: protein of unknown function with transrane region [Parcubacteria group bacterium]|nr:protein of unknown function with transrane region [Parcubacteria group bacterium]